MTAPAQQRPAPELRRDHRHHDVEHDREEQRLPRHRDRGKAEQQTHDRREGEHHDRVVERDLAQREIRIAVGQVRPDEDHRRAGRGGEQDQAGDVAVDLPGRQPGAEQPADKEPAEHAPC